MIMIKRKRISLIVLFVTILSIFLYLSMNNSKASQIMYTQMNYTPVKYTSVKYTTSTEIFEEINNCYNGGSLGPMMTVPGVLNKDNTSKYVYWIFLSGTESVENQSTDFKSDILSAFEQESDYERNVMDHIYENIPKESNIVFAGHSLGGMVSQQLSSNTAITNHYNVIGTVTYGSPLVAPLGKEGSLKRFVDRNDFVPFLSISNTVFSAFSNNNVNYGISEYTNPMDAHLYSYGKENAWKGYDVLGTKDGDASFTFYKENKTYYKCPVLN